jgi:hypothetical protein
MTPVARIETLCKPLGRRVLVSAELASAVGNKIQLEPARCASSPRSARAERNFRFAALERCLGGKVARTCCISEPVAVPYFGLRQL